MKTHHYFILLILVLLWPGDAFSQPQITPELQTQLALKSPQDFIEINIRLSNQYDSQKLYAKSRSIGNHKLRREYVVSQLKEFSKTQQASLLSLLEELQALGQVRDIKSFWIGNLINCKATPEVILQLSSRKDLARLDYNQIRQVITTQPQNQEVTPKESEPEIEWNILKINANQVWEEGFTGEEIIVGVLDTGVNYNHLDLSGRMWEHPDYPYHGYNFTENNNNPMDNQSHGTHCAGTVAGNGTAGKQTGVAPMATIMALKVLNDGGSGTEAGVWAGIEFAVEHGAHIMSLSLGWSHSWNPDRTMWRITMDNALSAGVIAAVAAGNDGVMGAAPPNQVGTPGDVPPPWTHPDQTLEGGNSAVVCVGSTTNLDALSTFSSKGPVTWQNVSSYNDYPFNPGIGLIRPDVSAPGSDIVSLSHSSNDGYSTKSGTSMATPAVAGVMALMLSKNPVLTPEQISQILEETSVQMTDFKSNTYGSGRIDALAAINETPFMGVQMISYSLDDSQGNDNGSVNPGETISLNLLLANPTEEDIQGVKGILEINSPFVTLTDSIVDLGDFITGEERLIEGIFSFEIAEDIPGNHVIDFSLYAYPEDNIEDKSRSRFSETAQAPELLISELVVDDSQQGNNNGRLDPGEIATLKFKAENNGSLPSEETQFNLMINSPLIVSENNNIPGGVIQEGSYVLAEFVVSVHGAIPVGSFAGFDLGLSAGAYNIESSFTEKIGLILEDWNTGNLDQYNWQLEGDADWALVTDEVFEGSHAVKSGLIGSASETSLVIELDVIMEDSISFYYKTSSETNYDLLEFWIDDTRVKHFSGVSAWERASFAVEPGTHTFKWTYKKDGNVDEGYDCAYIDYIVFPSIEMTSAFAGFDDILCGSGQYPLDGFANLYDQLQWSTTGDGTFGNPQELQTWYLPGKQDISNGQVEINIQVSNGNSNPVTDSMILEIYPEATIDLGEDRLVCNNSTLLLDAGEGFVSYLWPDESTNQTFLVDPANYQQETEIWVIGINENGCHATDTIALTFDDCTAVNDPENGEFFKVFPNPASESFKVTWFNSAYSTTELKLYSSTGQAVINYSIQEAQGLNEYEFNTSALKPGIYFLFIENNLQTVTKKIIIN